MQKVKFKLVCLTAMLAVVVLTDGRAGRSGEAGVPRAGVLRAGAAVESITADKPTVPINDPLLVKVLAIDDGTVRAVIVTLDLGGAGVDLVAKLRTRLREELGIDETNVLVAASHNHHTNGQVAKDLLERTVKAAGRAVEGMVPVRAGAGSGREDRITMNRRVLLDDGRAWTIRRANPSPPDRQVAGVGRIDPEIGVLRLDRADGRVLAVVYNFAGHAYGGVPSGAATADFPGFASSVLEQSLDGSVALFLQGAAGDITPVRYKDVDTPPPTERLGTMLGLSTLAAVKRIEPAQRGTIRVASRTIKLPRRTDAEERIKSLEAEQQRILQFFDGRGCGTHGAGTFLNFKTFLPLYMKHKLDPDHPAYASYLYKQEELIGRDDLRTLDAENKKRVEKYLAAIENMEKLIRVRANLGTMKRHQKRGLTEPIEAEVQGIRIGRFVLITFPGEPFAEVGLRIKKRSPFEHTFMAAYANGHLGYAPAADAYKSEAYEDTLSPFAPQWQEIYEAAALEVIEGLK